MRPLLATSPLLLLLCVSFTSADLREPQKFGPKEQVPGMSVHPYFANFKPHEAARVQVSGNGRSCLGVYVFDPAGNCVALDDLKGDVNGAQYCDEMLANWIADGVGRYCVEI